MSEKTPTDDADKFGPFTTEPDLPPKLSELRQKLYRKAKTEPKFRFYTLYDRIFRPDVLLAAFNRVAANDGGPGVDGVRVDDVRRREGGVPAFLMEVHQALKTKTYRPEAVRRHFIPKPDGGRRPLGIPTIRDRVVQAATLLILEPVFEADFLECSFGFRPQRNAHDALHVIAQELRQGRSDVIDADLKSYFDSIPHEKLMACVQHRIADRSVLGLIRMWLDAPIEDPPEKPGSKPRRHRPTSGTPQGGVISPLLANIYLHWLDVPFHRPSGPGVFANAKLVRYADDFVILARHVGDRTKQWLRHWLEERMGLKLHPEKTRELRVVPKGDRLDFLGYSFQWRMNRRRSGHYLHLGPSPKAQKRARENIRERTAKRLGLLRVDEIVRRLNLFLRGWRGYFSLGYPSEAYSRLNYYVDLRLYRHLRRRSQRPYRPPVGKTWYAHLHRDLGLMRLRVADVRPQPPR